MDSTLEVNPNLYNSYDVTMNDFAASTAPGPAAGAPEENLLPAQLRTWMHLLAAAGAVEQSLRTRVKDAFGVSHDEFLILCLLADHPDRGLRMTQIAALLGRPKTRLTYQVTCLIKAGLVTRGGVCGDRRGIEVALTDKARRLLGETAQPLAQAVSQAVTQALGPDSRDALRALLQGAGEV